LLLLLYMLFKMLFFYRFLITATISFEKIKTIFVFKQKIME